jgi:hypothetical protein
MLDRKLYKIKSCNKNYKKKLKSINKTRERLNVVNYIQEVFSDLEDAYYDYLTYGDPSRDMYGQLIDKTSDEYLYDVDPNWLEYLGRNLTLEDETDPVQRAMNAYQAVKDYEQAWKKYGTKGRIALYFGVTNEQEAQEWLEGFCKDIE